MNKRLSKSVSRVSNSTGRRVFSPLSVPIHVIRDLKIVYSSAVDLKMSYSRGKQLFPDSPYLAVLNLEKKNSVLNVYS